MSFEKTINDNEIWRVSVDALMRVKVEISLISDGWWIVGILTRFHRTTFDTRRDIKKKVSSIENNNRQLSVNFLFSIHFSFDQWKHRVKNTFADENTMKQAKKDEMREIK